MQYLILKFFVITLQVNLVAEQFTGTHHVKTISRMSTLYMVLRRFHRIVRYMESISLQQVLNYKDKNFIKQIILYRFVQFYVWKIFILKLLSTKIFLRALLFLLRRLKNCLAKQIRPWKKTAMLIFLLWVWHQNLVYIIVVL